VSTVFTAAAGFNPTNMVAFIGPVLTVTVAAGQKVYVSSNKVFGTTLAAGANNLNLYVCYQSTAPAGLIQAVGQGMFGLNIPANTRIIYGINADFTPGVGAFFVGMCGSSGNAASWNNNEYAYVTAIVHN
jgi:hypothetical protein